MEPTFSQYARKTVVALILGLITAVTTVLGLWIASLAADSDGGSLVTTPEKIKMATAFLISLAGTLGSAFGVYQATNAPTPVRLLRRTDGTRP